jgi:hypothetical protein
MVSEEYRPKEPKHSQEEINEMVQNIVELGFPRDIALQALKDSNYQITIAVERLLNSASIHPSIDLFGTEYGEFQNQYNILNENERAAVNILRLLGYPAIVTLQTYIMAERNEDLAHQYLTMDEKHFEFFRYHFILKRDLISLDIKIQFKLIINLILFFTNYFKKNNQKFNFSN